MTYKQKFWLGFFITLTAWLALFAATLPRAHAASCGSYPFTLQNNTTADATQVMSNFNTVRNCVINNAAGSGVNTDITSITGLSTPLSVPQGGTPVFIGGTSTGTANAQVVASTSPIGYSLTSGYRVTFTAGATNTGATQLNVNSTGLTTVQKLGHAGLEALTGGEIVSGNIVEALYNGTVFVLLSTPFSDFGPLTNIATGTTVDLGTVPSHNANITSSGSSIASFGSTAVANEPTYLIKFAGANTLVYNATSMLIPGAGNITTAANDTAVVSYLGSGNWQVLSYTRYSGAGIVAVTPLCGASNFTANVNSGTPTTSYDMAADTAVMVDTSGVSITASTVSVTVNATVNGANGLDTGSLGASTGYFGWLINNGTTTAGLLSTSATTPTMPSGYTYKCRLTGIFTDGSSQFLRVRQSGKRAQYQILSPSTTTAFPSLGNSSGTGLTSLSVTGKIPTTARTLEFFCGSTSNGSLAVAANNQTSNSSFVTNPSPFMNAGPTSTGLSGSLFLEGTSFYVSMSSGTATCVAVGWNDAVNAN